VKIITLRLLTSILNIFISGGKTQANDNFLPINKKSPKYTISGTLYFFKIINAIRL
jgi:hypothetical protein